MLKSMVTSLTAVVSLVGASESDLAYKGHGSSGYSSNQGQSQDDQSHKKCPLCGSMYDESTVETVSGKITKTEVQPAMSKGWQESVVIILKMENQEIPIHLGPTWFVEHQPIRFHPTETIEVKGSKVKLEGEDVIVAQSVKKDDQTLILREEDGTPKWFTVQHKKKNP